jgi:hypothetical protein
MLGFLGLALAAGTAGCRPESIERAIRATRNPYKPRFFTPEEWKSVRVLADLVIPKDDRSASATEAQVPEFLDFVMAEEMESQETMRAGLAWLDAESTTRFGRHFAGAGEESQSRILDDIAWPARARPEHQKAAEFFTAFRNLTATGFWSSRIGVEDLHYIGNTAVAEWKGCPPEQLRKLGVSGT